MTEQERQIRRSDRLRIGVILALCLIVAVPVMVAFAADPSGASSDPSAAAPLTDPSAAPAGTAKPDATDKADKDLKDLKELKGFKGLSGLNGFLKGDHAGNGGRGAVTITAIIGSKISLKTDDGWTRTITVAADTKISKAGVAAKLSDLSVGDKIRFGQKKNDDGTFSITSITIPTAHTGGEVTAVGASTLTIKLRNGDSRTIKLTGDTAYKVGFADGTKASVKVGSRVSVVGDEAGTSFTALRVDVQLTVVAGDVTKKTADSVAITTRDGKTVVIHLSAKTEFRILGKKGGTLADVAVGDKVLAAGVARADGSIDAQALGAGKLHGFKIQKDPKPTTVTPGA